MTWSSAHRGGIHGNFISANKHGSYGKDLNTLVASALVKSIRSKQKPKGKHEDGYDLDTNSNHFNLENMDIGEESNLEWDHGHR